MDFTPGSKFLEKCNTTYQDRRLVHHAQTTITSAVPAVRHTILPLDLAVVRLIQAYIDGTVRQFYCYDSPSDQQSGRKEVEKR